MGESVTTAVQLGQLVVHGSAKGTPPLGGQQLGVSARQSPGPQKRFDFCWHSAYTAARSSGELLFLGVLPFRQRLLLGILAAEGESMLGCSRCGSRAGRATGTSKPFFRQC